MVPMIDMLRDAHGHPIWGFHIYALPGTEFNKVGREVRYFELGGTQVKVTDTCKRYLGLLDKLLREFMEAHRSSTP
jgi:hypothetical protein